MIKEKLYDIYETIFSPITNGVEKIMTNVEGGIIKIERRVLMEVSSLLIMGLGGLFLVFALFFFMIEFLELGKAISFFSVGVIVFVIGILLKEYN